MNRSEHKPSRIRLALVAVIGTSIVTVAGVGAFAGLNAKATATQTQGAGTLNLTTQIMEMDSAKPFLILHLAMLLPVM
jgi:hypothetical protein